MFLNIFIQAFFGRLRQFPIFPATFVGSGVVIWTLINPCLTTYFVKGVSRDMKSITLTMVGATSLQMHGVFWVVSKYYKKGSVCGVLVTCLVQQPSNLSIVGSLRKKWRSILHVLKCERTYQSSISFFLQIKQTISDLVSQRRPQSVHVMKQSWYSMK